MSRNVYVIAGPNGAGKTTFAREFLPNYANCRNFINADLIAQGVSPFSPEAAAFRAGRLMIEEIRLHAGRGHDFGFETTLAGRSYVALLRGLQAKGYDVHFFFLGLPHVDLALSRIRARVAEGGHDVPEAAVRRRFDRSLQNFFLYYRHIGSSWTLFDNSGAIPEVIAAEKQHLLQVVNQVLYDKFRNRLEYRD